MDKEARDVSTCIATAARKLGYHAENVSDYVDDPDRTNCLVRRYARFADEPILDRFVYENPHPDWVVLVEETIIKAVNFFRSTPPGPRRAGHQLRPGPPVPAEVPARTHAGQAGQARRGRRDRAGRAARQQPVDVRPRPVRAGLRPDVHRRRGRAAGRRPGHRRAADRRPGGGDRRAAGRGGGARWWPTATPCSAAPGSTRSSSTPPPDPSRPSEQLKTRTPPRDPGGSHVRTRDARSRTPQAADRGRHAAAHREGGPAAVPDRQLPLLPAGVPGQDTAVQPRLPDRRADPEVPGSRQARPLPGRLPHHLRGQPDALGHRPGLLPPLRDRLQPGRARRADRHPRGGAVPRRLRPEARGQPGQAGPAPAERQDGGHRGLGSRRPRLRLPPAPQGLRQRHLRGPGQARGHAAGRHPRLAPARGDPRR